MTLISIPASYGMTYSTHMQMFKVNGQSAARIEWKQTDGRTDGRTEAIALPAALMRSVKINIP